MDLRVDPRDQVRESVGSLAPSHLWMLGLAVDDDGSIVGPGRRRESYWAECECPGDCLRDHEND